MHSASGRYTIVFNGEIYNWLEIRKRLESRGTRFRGNSDTEVLIEAMDAWGLDETLGLCVGMFAFALWDSRDRVLHLVRDRLGEKPLYLLHGRGWMAFASELKAFAALRAWTPQIDRAAVSEFVSYGYIGAPRSIFKGVSKLPPGSRVALGWKELVEGKSRPEFIRYWNLPPQAEAETGSPDPEVLDQFEELLKASVSAQSLADVPVGAFLSGGVDSSTVVALLQSVSSSPVRTFTVRFPVASHDESGWARAVADALGTQHTVIELAASDLLEAVPEMGRVFDEPFADPSQVPTYLISREARRHVKVCLTGDGGDEVFGGYNRYVQFRRAERMIRSVPSPVRGGVATMLESLPVTWLDAMARHGRASGSGGPLQSAGARVHKLAAMMRMSDSTSRYQALLMTGAPGSLLPDVPVAQGGAHPAMQGGPIEDLMMRSDLLSYLPDDNLVKVDRASMAHSLECRAPMLDHRVVEAALCLPVHQRIRQGKGKWVLRGIFQRYLPAELLDRPKAGFSVPVSAWFRQELRSWLTDSLQYLHAQADGLFDMATADRLAAEHLRGDRDHGRVLWALAMFSSWYAQHARSSQIQRVA